MAFLPQVKGWPWSGTKRTTVFQITGSCVLIAGQNWSLINTAIYITRKLDLSSTVANKEGIHSEKISQFRQFIELVPWTHARGLISSLCTKSKHSLFLKTLPPKCVAQKQTLCSNWECKGEKLVQKAFIGISCRNNVVPLGKCPDVMELQEDEFGPLPSQHSHKRLCCVKVAYVVRPQKGPKPTSKVWPLLCRLSLSIWRLIQFASAKHHNGITGRLS